jgi:hypothetical protein
MTISLLSLTKYEDTDLVSARWLDDAYGIQFEFNAVHHSDGRPLARTEDCPAPALTAEQLSQAQPFQEPASPQHPAYELAAKGTAVRPDWSARYQKAAQLVEAGQVRLTGPETAVVSSSQAHTITTRANSANGRTSCTCKWGQFQSEPCSHVIAVRMARALSQPIEPVTEAEKEAACAARRQANRDAMQLRVARRGENKFEAARRAQYHTAEGARRYVAMAMANGATSIRPDIWQRANGQTAVAGAGGD